MSDSEAYETGMKTRREVLGDAHVDRAEAAAGEFGAPFQEFITPLWCHARDVDQFQRLPLFLQLREAPLLPVGQVFN